MLIMASCMEATESHKAVTSARLEPHVLEHAEPHDPARLHLPQAINGVGKAISRRFE